MGLLSPLAHGTFARFFAGQAVSQLGDYAFFVAITWEVVERTGSETALGLVMGAYTAAQLLLLAAGGVVVDRVPRRAVVVASDVAQGAIAAAVALLATTGRLEVHHVYAFAAAFGAAQAFAVPAVASFVPDTVPPASLQAANALVQTARGGGAVLGPALGAALVAWGGTTPAFWLNAATFSASALLLANARPARSEPGARRGASALEDAKEGLRHVASVPWLWITIALFAILNAAESGPRNSVLPFFARDALGAGVDGLGLLLGAMAAGSLAAFLALGALPPLKRRGRAAYGAIALAGAATVALASARTLAQAVALEFVLGAAFGVFAILWETSLQDQVPARVRGRVNSLDLLGSFALLPIAGPIAGKLAALVGARAVIGGGGLVVLACALVGLAVRRAHAFTAEDRARPPRPARARGEPS